MYASTDHGATPSDKDAHNRMNLHYPLPPGSSQHAMLASVHASLADAPGHTSDDG